MGWSATEEHTMKDDCISEEEEEEEKGNGDEIDPLCPNINVLNDERTRLRRP